MDTNAFLDQTELLQWAKDNIEDAEKVIVILAKPTEQIEAPLKIIVAQIGFKYLYEVDGFLHYALDAFIEE